MNLAFSEEQELLRHALRRMLADRLSSRRLHDLAASGEPDHALWRDLAGSGLQGTRIPEALNGAEAGYLELCVYAEELGHSLAPTPAIGSVFLSTEALLDAGSPGQRNRLLPRLAAGEISGAAILDRALALGGGETLTGDLGPIAHGAEADFIVLRVAGRGGEALRLVDLAQPGVTRRPVESLDPLSPVARLSLDGVTCEPLGPDATAAHTAEALLVRAAVLVAFQQLGGAQAALDQAVAYVRERRAFGRQIGSFQAIKHMLADVYVAIELARSNAFHAAWALSSNSAELPLAAATARVSATRAYQHAARANTQAHGGLGFTWAADCHLHYRRAALLGVILGPQSAWERRLVAQLDLQNAA